MFFKRTNRSVKVQKGYAQKVGNILTKNVSLKVCAYNYGHKSDEYCTLSVKATDFEWKKVLNDLDTITKIDASIVKFA